MMKAFKILIVLLLLLACCSVTYLTGYNNGHADGVRWCKNFYQEEGIIE